MVVETFTTSGSWLCHEGVTSVDVPVQLIEELRSGLDSDDSRNAEHNVGYHAARNLLQWVDSH